MAIVVVNIAVFVLVVIALIVVIVGVVVVVLIDFVDVVRAVVAIVVFRLSSNISVSHRVTYFCTFLKRYYYIQMDICQ